MFRPLRLGHHQVTIEWNMEKLHTVIHKHFILLWPDDGPMSGRNMLSRYHLKWNKVSICNTSCVLTCGNFIPYLYYIEQNGDGSPKETGWNVDPPAGQGGMKGSNLNWSFLKKSLVITLDGCKLGSSWRRLESSVTLLWELNIWQISNGKEV
jgi:hypothetical protein